MTLLSAEARQHLAMLGTDAARARIAQDEAERDQIFDAAVEKCAALFRDGARPRMGTPIEVAIDAWAIVNQEQRREVIELRAEVRELREKVERIDDEMLNGPESV